MNYKLWGIMTLLAALTISVGCSSSGTTETLGTSNYLVTALDAQRIGYTPRWAMNLIITPGSELKHVTTLGDVVVAVESPSNWVICVDGNDGSIRWRSKWLSENERLYEPSRSENLIVINSGKQLFHLDVNTGKLVTMSTLEEQVNDGPVIADNMAIFGSLSGKVYAHDIQTGFSRWDAEMPAGIVVRPIIVGQNVFAADATGIYALFNMRSGERLWTGRTFAQVSAKPAASETTQLVYVASEDQNLYALNRATGNDRWIYRTTEPLRNDPVLLGNTLFITQKKSLTAVDAISGNKIWSLDRAYHAIDMIDQKLIVNADVYLMILDATTGKRLREVPFMQPIQSILTGPDDSLVIVSPDGKIERLDPQR